MIVSQGRHGWVGTEVNKQDIRSLVTDNIYERRRSRSRENVDKTPAQGVSLRHPLVSVRPINRRKILDDRLEPRAPCLTSWPGIPHRLLLSHRSPLALTVCASIGKSLQYVCIYFSSYIFTDLSLHYTTPYNTRTSSMRSYSLLVSPSLSLARIHNGRRRNTQPWSIH